MEIGTVQKNPVSGFFQFWDGEEWSSSFYPRSDAVKYAKEYMKLIGIKKEPEKKPEEPIVDKFSQFFTENAVGI